MQKVERKQHQERKHRRLIWLAAVLVLLAGSVTAAVLLSRKPVEEIPEEEVHWGMLINRQEEELVSVTVCRRGKEAWTLYRTENGTLMPENGGDWTVAEQQGQLLQEAVTQLRYEEILTEDPEVYRANPADFGLEEPLVTVTARYTDQTEKTIRIGNDTGLEDDWHYVTADGDDRLYAVAAALVEDLNIEYELLHPVPRPEIYASLLDRITIYDSEKVITEWVLQGDITDRDAASNWAVTVPFHYPTDEETMQNLKKSAENLRLGAYTAPATEENLEKYGFDIPRRILYFHMAAGSTGTVSDSGVYDVTEHAENTVMLIIGGAPDDLADYVRFGEEIFTVSHFTMAAFLETKPMDTVAKYPVLTPLESLERVTVEENGEVREYVLQEAESTEDEDAAKRCLLNGKEIPWNTFEAAYDRLLTVTFSGTLPKDAEWKDGYKKFTFHTLSGGTHTVILSDWDSMHDAVTVDGSTLFYLIKGGMTDLPVQEASD